MIDVEMKGAIVRVLPSSSRNDTSADNSEVCAAIFFVDKETAPPHLSHCGPKLRREYLIIAAHFAELCDWRVVFEEAASRLTQHFLFFV